MWNCNVKFTIVLGLNKPSSLIVVYQNKFIKMSLFVYIATIVKIIEKNYICKKLKNFGKIICFLIFTK